jgi:hypothetical protein
VVEEERLIFWILSVEWSIEEKSEPGEFHRFLLQQFARIRERVLASVINRHH